MAAAAAPPPSSVLLVACGSFSPPTLMHLRMMEVARDCLLLEHGIVISHAVCQRTRGLFACDVWVDLTRCS